MALSSSDHLQALRNQLLNAEKDLERDYQTQLAEIREMIRVLDTAPKLLAGMKSPALPALAVKTKEPQHAGRTLANRNVTALTREWLSDFRKMDEKIEIENILTFLVGKGVTGKHRSLYSAVHVILKKEAEASDKSPNPPWLRHKAGFGFYKTWKDGNRIVS